MVILIISYLMIFSLIFPFILSIKVSLPLMYKERTMLSKASPFECGFNTKNLFRMNQSMQFFMVALLFLIFDVELLLLLPFLQKFFFFYHHVNLIFMIMLLLVIIFSTIYEWNMKTLNWEF